MAVNETIVTNRYFRRCTDAANKVWQRISFWHKASDCEFDDGSTAQTKVGAIKGITTSTSVTETGYAADMTTVKGLQTQIDELNSNLGNKTVLSNLSRQTTGSNNLKSVFNISNLYSKYKSISIDDIFIKVKSFKVSGVSDFTWSFFYDPSTGLITVDSGQTALLCYPTNIDVFITK